MRFPLSAFQSFAPSIESKLGQFRVGSGLRSSGTSTRGLVMAGSRFFSNSARQYQRQRFTLQSTKSKTKFDRNGGHHNRGRRQHQQQIPPYVYFMGGVPIVGSLYLYFRFQDQAPLTGRSRWLATNPKYERRMGDEVSAVQNFCVTTRKKQW